MNIEYDKEVDGLYIWFHPIENEKGNYSHEIWPKEFKDEIGFIFSKDNKVMGIEIQPASKYLSDSMLHNIVFEIKSKL